MLAVAFTVPPLAQNKEDDMFKTLTAIIGGTLIALAITPAGATHKDGPHGDSQFIQEVLSLLKPKILQLTRKRLQKLSLL